MDFIFRGIGIFLGWLDGLTGNYLFAILIFALIVELLMLPFGIKQQKNSRRQAKLRPKEMAIRRKYAGRTDQATQQKITTEIQELYQKENFSPFAGCLPMLIQLPIILIIYQVVINPLQYVSGMDVGVVNNIAEALGKTTVSPIVLMEDIKAAGSLAGVQNLVVEGKELSVEAVKALSELDFASLPDLSVFGLNLGYTPSITEPSWLLIVPALTFIVYFFSTKLSRKFLYQPNMAADDRQAACSNTMMDWMMPIMSIFISFSVPAAIGVYWIFKSIIGTVKQFILSKAMPLPVYTEEDIKLAEKELRGKASTQAPREVSSKPVRSLHHIDDDDDEPYPTFVKKKSYYDKTEEERKADGQKSETSDSEAKTNGMVSGAPLKEDEKDSDEEAK